MNSKVTSHVKPTSLQDQIPGFKGYQDIEDRRESDRLLRQRIADLLEASRHSLERRLAREVDQGILSSLAMGERLKRRIDQLRLELATRSTDVEVFYLNEQFADGLLTEMRELETQLISLGISLSVTLESMSATICRDSSQDAMQECGKQLDDLTRHARRRCQLIRGVSQAG